MITQSELKDKLHYCPDTGVFTWIKPHCMAKSISPGDRAGSTKSDGYTAINTGGINHLQHRLAFLYMTGSMPEGHVDHINQKRNESLAGQNNVKRQGCAFRFF
ncbi:MAG: hypothetical protein JKY52_09275 [Flavobacteriales bacterium]|nr:hypothetical protein [Flavobacteriales bacterium]